MSSMPRSRDDEPILEAPCATSGAGAGGTVRRWLPLGLVATAAALVFLLDLDDALSLQSFLSHRAAIAAYVDAHTLLALAATMAIYTLAVALSLPGGLVLTLVTGFLFGPVVGGIAVAIAATTGATLLFLAARSSLGDSLRRKAGPRLERLAEGFRNDAFNYLLFLRLVPVAPFWLVNLAPALIGVPTRTYVAATAIGILPATFVFATIGAGLDSVVAAQQAANAACLAGAACDVQIDVGRLVTPEIVAGLAGLGLLALIPVGVRHWRRRRGTGS